MLTGDKELDAMVKMTYTLNTKKLQIQANARVIDVAALALSELEKAYNAWVSGECEAYHEKELNSEALPPNLLGAFGIITSGKAHTYVVETDVARAVAKAKQAEVKGLRKQSVGVPGRSDINGSGPKNLPKVIGDESSEEGLVVLSQGTGDAGDADSDGGEGLEEWTKAGLKERFAAGGKEMPSAGGAERLAQRRM